MRRLLFGVLVAALYAASAPAQPAKQPITSGYLVIRVVLDAGGGEAFAAGGAPGGAPGDPAGGGRGGPPPGGGRGGPPGAPGGGGRGGPPGAPGGGRGGGGGEADGGEGGGFGGAGGFGGGFTGAANISSDPSKSIVVVVPFHDLMREPLYPPGTRGNKQMLSIRHQFGKTYLFSDNTSIQFYPNTRLTYENEVRRRHSDWSKNRVLSDGYRLCRDALTHGMLKEAFQYSRELANQVAIKSDVKPSPDVSEFVAAFQSFESSIDTPPAKSSNAVEWQRRVAGEAITESTHYTMIHPRDIPPEEIKRRLDMLETNFRAFYLWHAMSRMPLPLPQTKLTVILPRTASDVDRIRVGLDGSDVVSDATFARHHNIVIMSPERLDENSRAFQNLVAPLWREGYSREDLLKGIAPKNVSTRTPEDHARAMTLALVDKALEVESDFAALTREGTRQLYIASGQLPKDVTLPEWVESGSSSLFQKPKGPLFVKEGSRNLMTVSLSAGYGSPNFQLRRYFQTLERSGRLNPDRAELLINTVSDKYFHAARTGDDIDPVPMPPPGAAGRGGPAGSGAGPGGPRGGDPRQPPGGRRGPGGPGGAQPPGEGGGISEGGGPPPPEQNQDPEEGKRKSKADLEIKARTTAWALAYYLSREKLPGLQEFYRQLSRMPRDLHLDEKTVLTTFCRSFNLMKGDEIDRQELDRFAQGWIDYMKKVPVLYMDIPINEGAGASGPGGPGGFPGRGGPGGPGGGGPGGAGGGPGGTPG